MRLPPLFRPLLLLCTLFIMSIAAQAQVRYAFVSMTGNDANNCWSATTACRTFQRAHDAVSAGGTVVARDSGGYGPITITKSVTITGEGVEAGLTATGAGAIGININKAGVVVRLRYLNITGLNTSGSNNDGIRFFNGAALHVEHCTITGFKGDNSGGIRMITPAQLYVSDSVFRNNDSGILIFAGTSITIERTLVEENGTFGIDVQGGKVTIRKSRVAGNNNVGILARASSAQEVTVDDCNISHNTTGISTEHGAVVRVANSIIANNGTGLSALSGGQILSRVPASNTVEGNGANGSFTGTYTAQ